MEVAWTGERALAELQSSGNHRYGRHPVAPFAFVRVRVAYERVLVCLAQGA